MAESVIKPNVSASQGEEAIKRIRITLTSRNVSALEALCSELKSKALKEGVAVAGPVRLPTKHLRITTRKSPCGEGTNTWDRWEMRIHKRILDLEATTSIVRTITSVDISPDIEVAVNVSSKNRRRRRR
jgi:small subunit ribosomal protein S20e